MRTFFGLEWCAKMEKEKKVTDEIVPLFATPVVRTNIGRDLTKEEIDCLTDISMLKKEGMSNHRSKDLYLFDNLTKELKDIKDFCTDQLKTYLEKIEGIDTNIATLRITQSWLNKSKPDEWHHVHFHPNSYLSGVFYIRCLSNDGINFDNRVTGSYNNIKFQMPKEMTVWNSVGVTVSITEGDLVLFPSWVPHSVNPNETKNKERISLSFNTFPIGEIGEYELGTHLKL